MHYLADVAAFAFVVLAVATPAVLLGSGLRPAKEAAGGLDTTLLIFGGGLAGCSLILAVVGAFSTAAAVTAVLVCLILCTLCPWVLPAWRAQILDRGRALFCRLRGLRGIHLALAIYLAALCGLTFVLTLAPPSGADYDSLMYHLAAPAQYLQAGHIVELPYDHHTYFPFALEMMYLFGLWLRGPVLAKLFHWLMLPLCCAAIIALGRRHHSVLAGLCGAALFASLPVVQTEASTAYIDLGLAAFSLLAFLGMSNWLVLRDPRALCCGGVFAGVCMGVKYLGVLTCGWLFLWLLGAMALERRLSVAPIARFGLAAALVGGGWYLRNWWWTGNPVFPFAYELFDGRGWTLAMAHAYTRHWLHFGFGRAPSDWLWLPWRAAMTPLNVEVAEGHLAGIPFWPLTHVPLKIAGVDSPTGLFEVPGMVLQTMIGPPLLAFGAPMVFLRGKPRIVGFALWTFLFFALVWAVTGQYLRYLVPAFAILCIACGWGVCWYAARSPLLRWTTAVCLALWFLFTPLFLCQSAGGTWPVILGQETEQEYLTRSLAAYPAMEWASKQAPRDSRFAVYGEARCFYLRRSYFWADDAHNNLIDYPRISTGADLVQALIERGATHVLWNTVPELNGGAFGPPGQLAQAVAQRRLTLLFEARGYQIYRIDR